MPTPVPFVIGTTSSAVSSATYTVAVTTASPANNWILVAADASGATSASSVTDTQGNSYSAISVNAVTQFASLFLAQTANPLSTADTITVTYAAANTQQKNIIVMSAAGINANDTNGHANGTSTAPSVTSTTLLYGLELAVAVFSYANAGGALTLAPGWTAISTVHTGTNQFTVVAYSISRLGTGVVTPTITASGTIVSAAWTVLLSTFRIPLLSVQSIPVFPAGWAPSDSDMTGWVTNPLSFCTSGVVFQAEQTATQSLTANTYSGNTITFDTVIEDPYSGWSPITDQWTAPQTGWYEMIATVGLAAAAGSLGVAFIISGTRYEMSIMPMSSLNTSATTSHWIAHLLSGIDTASVAVNPIGAGPYSTANGVTVRSSFEISFLST